jgi:hypothetical protein
MIMTFIDSNALSALPKSPLLIYKVCEMLDSNYLKFKDAHNRRPVVSLQSFLPCLRFQQQALSPLRVVGRVVFPASLDTLTITLHPCNEGKALPLALKLLPAKQT